MNTELARFENAKKEISEKADPTKEKMAEIRAEAKQFGINVDHLSDEQIINEFAEFYEATIFETLPKAENFLNRCNKGRK